MNPDHHGSTQSSTPTMEPSQPSPVDYVHPSPMDALKQIREMYEKIDPDEQIKPCKRFESSESMSLGHHESTPSSPLTMEPYQPFPLGCVLPPPPMDTIESIREMFDKIDPVEQIDPLICFVESQLHKMNTPLEAGSSSSEGWLAKYIRKYSEQMPEEIQKLCNAVGTIVEGAVICCDYVRRERYFRFWSATTAAAHLEKTNQLRDLRDFRGLSVGLQSPKQSTMPLGYSSVQLLAYKDVFLSHSGKQKNFVRQLHPDLNREHVSCFFDEDDSSLPLAQKFSSLIFKAQTCKVAVVVLSKEFIHSKWPMLELSAFMSTKNSGKNPRLIFFPIFFKISLKELSYITKDSPEWKKLVESNKTRDKWQAALKEVRYINGLQLGEDGNEVDCRDKALKEICCFLRGINPPKLFDFEPVGIEEQVREVKALLDIEGAQSALAVIVCGFGVGKSTLAASFVQSLDWSSMDFKFCRVAIYQKAQDKTSHIIKFQKNILYDLVGGKAYLRDPHDGRRQIKQALKKQSSLLFIDNVVEKDYIQELLPEDLSSNEQKTESHPKQRILVTSGDKNVEAELNINCEVHEVATLSKPASQYLLFQTIVQGKGKVVEDKELDEKGMINEVADACRGVTLLLSVFGKHLRIKRFKDSYREAQEALRVGNLDSYPDEDLGTKFMFVYHKIKDARVKDVFFDICTYFHGLEWNLVANIVDAFKLGDLGRRMLVSGSC